MREDLCENHNGDPQLARLKDEMEQVKALYQGAKEAFEMVRKKIDVNPLRLPVETLKQAMHTQESLLEIYAQSVRLYNQYLFERLDSRIHNGEDSMNFTHPTNSHNRGHSSDV